MRIIDKLDYSVSLSGLPFEKMTNREAQMQPMEKTAKPYDERVCGILLSL